MNQEVKIKWIAALRSGKYQQTHYQLRDDYGHCCLGVLCEVAKQEGVIAVYSGGSPIPSYDVEKWVDMNVPRFGVLTSWNDRDRLTFKQIADRLEAM